MEFDAIATFVQVVRSGSFSGAAAVLDVPKSTVSRRIARLEADLGVRLVQRTTRTMRATSDGQEYFARVASSIDALKDANLDVREGQDEPRGLLRISAPVDVGYTVLAPLVAEFVAAHPRVQVHVELSGRRVDLVEEGFDLAVRAGPLPDSTLVARKLGAVTFHAVAAPSYLDERPTIRRPADLAHHDCVRFRPRAKSGTWSLEGPKGAVDVEVSGRVGGDDMGFLKAMTLAGAGVALLPSFLVQDEVDRGTLRRVLPRHAMGGGQVHLVFPSARHLPKKTAAFRDLLVDAFAQL